MAALADEWGSPGKDIGLELWRIEKMVPVRQPEVNGKFYSGDSYILLSTSKSKRGNALEWNLHFWLGDETSQDEMTVAAYKSVELDEALGGGPIQHREVQGHESELFASYFKKTGIEYMPGGIDSGMNKVEKDVYRTRLLQCKGKRSVRVSEKPCEASSLNKGDVFILDMGLTIYLFNGVDSNKYEKVKGGEICQKVNNERGGRCKIVLLEDEPDCSAFWDALGGKIEVTDPGEDDEAAATAAAGAVKLFHIDGDSGDVTTSEVPAVNGKFTKDMLDGDDSYILDSGSAIFVWIGKTANKLERKEAMVQAQKYIVDNGRPAHIPIERLAEGGETAMFKSFFENFDPPMTPDMVKAPSGNVAGMPEERSVDFAAMHSKISADEAPLSSDAGKLTIWRIEDFEKVEVPEEKYGQFYGGDSYIVLYTYMDRNRECHMIYFWQGKESSTDEKGASALQAKNLDDELGGSATQCRVVHGKEPGHFRHLFKGGMIIHDGGKASGFKNAADGDSFDDDGISLFHVRGTDFLNTYGEQVEEKPSSLNSVDCFVLVTPTHTYSWHGKGSNEGEKATADSIAKVLSSHSYGPPGTAPPSRELVQVEEESEPEEFWAALGGKADYAQLPAGVPVPADPRLFQCTDRFGAFTVEEIANFTQEDLLDDDVYILDVKTAVYLWIGHNANLEEKTKAMETAVNYNATANDGRDADCTIIKVKMGQESMLFTQFFGEWDPDLMEKNKFVDPYEAKMAALREAKGEGAEDVPVISNAVAAAGAASLNPDDGFLPTSTKFPLGDLQAGCPEGVDPTKKEEYLSDADFSAAFGMSLPEFQALAAWKKKQKKQACKLW
jgi:hypothetical protein